MHPRFPPELWPRRVLILMVRAYRFFISPALVSSCRFEPSCSAYALLALERHGAVFGTGLTLHRLARCGPWCAGGHDPVPDEGASRRSHVVCDRAAAGSTPSSSPSDSTSLRP